MAYWQDKVVLVTGGSAGLGLAIARAAFARGACLVLAARDAGHLTAAAEQLGAEAGQGDVGKRVLPVPADVTQQDHVDALVERARAEFGRLHALFNCAGRSARGDALATSPEHYRALWELNFLGLVRCTQAAVPLLLESQGHVVNIGSLACKSASRYLGAYPASKFPVAAFSQQLRLELEPRGVHTLLVCPGPIARPDAGARYAMPEDVPASARQPGGGVKLKGLDAERLADRILQACQKRRAELVVPGRARLLFAISQLAPRWGDWIVRRMT
jgi:NAD(P)-dependent dehydrogenase (short-subunit alcohol dehydrogenase family)